MIKRTMIILTKLLRYLLLALLIAPFGGAHAQIEPPTLLELVHRNRPDGVRLILGFDQEPTYSLFTLTDPLRLVIDLAGVTWQAGEVTSDDIPYLTALRHGVFLPGETRIVMDLAEPLGLDHVSIRERGERFDLVLDLGPVSREVFDAGAGWPEGARWTAAQTTLAPHGTDLIVAIDPGHGGIDPGAIAGDLLEKDVVLAIGLTLAERIGREPGMTAVLTRDADRFLPLRARLRIARQARAHVFLSLHADTITEGQADGMSIYTLSDEASDKAADLFAERENRSDVLAGADLEGEDDDVTRLLVDLARRGTDVESDRLGREILGAMSGEIDLIRSRPLRQAGFYVLRSPDLPSALIELGFLSSEADRERLLSPEHAEKMADAMVEALKNWRKTADPAYTAPRGRE